MTLNKGKSPFYPGQPVPIEFFIGRIEEIKRISRSIQQVEMGKPQAVFLTGEYGIGKSSLANIMRYSAWNNHIFGIHVFLGGAQKLEDVATKTVEAVIKSQLYETTISDKIRNFLSKYLAQQIPLFGLAIDFKALKADGPDISKGYLPFLRELFNRLKDDSIKGLMLILDEINGITANPQFSHFIKSLVDENALADQPLPIMLMLCGIEERRRDMVKHHQPVERIFDIVEINPMNDKEMREFFAKSFESSGMRLQKEAMSLLCHYSAGFPKIMHIIGDAVFWLDEDNCIDEKDAINGISYAAEDIAKKFVDQQVYKALHSKDYHSILKKLAQEKFDLSFMKGTIEKGLTENEKKKFNNFLQRMKKLKVLKSGDERGEYIFISRLVRLYILLNSISGEVSLFKH